MKKIMVFALASIFAPVLYSAGEPAKTPELLKQRDKFADISLFDARSIYADRKANLELLKSYRDKPESFSDAQLFPVAVCFLTFRDYERARAALEKLSAAQPKNITVWRTLGSVDFLAGDMKSAVEAYRKAISLGDGFSSVYCGNALMLSGRAGEVKEFLPEIVKFAPSNLEALNVLLTYSIEHRTPEVAAFLKSAFEKIEPKKVLLSATPDSLRLAVRVYQARPEVWTIPALVVPARGAALFENWPLALRLYKKILEEEPGNTLARRGMGLVQYRLGDVSAAAAEIKKAFDSGDKDAAVDGVELFLLSKYRFVWDMFKDKLDVSKTSLEIRAGLIQYAAGQSDCAEMFYSAVADPSSDVLFKDSKVAALARQCLDKYASDARSRGVAERLFNASKK